MTIDARQAFEEAKANLREAEKRCAQEWLDFLETSEASDLIDKIRSFEGSTVENSPFEQLCISIISCLGSLENCARDMVAPVPSLPVPPSA
ncbi:hypothetical protein [Sphingobium lignivorans]|uniref:Uncharacterized protein n=1 Tax=Sphingobium lignivorans TaxID=2735886 RepID=A0ABR6NF84_9SPHN|nr:hypothetical protein [Sphingobium lignivorans]MBB5985940.1 hypothetical protein [Sphingobium lignivorans]